MREFVSGMHKSPYRGFSVEFAQHREYVPGDDLRHLDWKIFGKSDRFVIKQYEEETNLRAHLFLDQSESMNYGADETIPLPANTTTAVSIVIARIGRLLSTSFIIKLALMWVAAAVLVLRRTGRVPVSACLYT